MENPERVRGGRGGREGQPGARDGGEGAKGEDTEWSQREIRSLKTRVGQECSISRLYSGGIHVRGVQGESHSVTSWDTEGGGQLQE